MKRFLFSLILIACSSLTAQSQTQGEPTMLGQALSKLDQGIRLLEQRDPAAKPTIREAAADIQRAIDTEGLVAAGAYQALGNAYMLTEDYGQAVLAFRRGEQIAPTDPRLRDSLKFAREQVAISVTPSTTNRIMTLLMSWRGVVPRTLLWAIFVSCFSLAWLMLIARTLFAAPRWFSVSALWFLGLALVPFAALSAEWKLYKNPNDAVLMQGQVIARSGPDDSIYDPVYAEPLDAGTEAVIAEQRDHWARLVLADGSECWVRADTLARVNP